MSEVGWKALIATLERFSISYSVRHVVPIVGNIVPALSIDCELRIAVTVNSFVGGSYNCFILAE